MPTRRKHFSMDHPIVVTFLLMAIVAAMSWAGEFLRPLALAILLSFALAPLSRFLERRGVPRTLAVVLTVVTALTALGGVAYVVGRQLTSLARHLNEYQHTVTTKFERLQPAPNSPIAKVVRSALGVAETIDEGEKRNVVDVRVVSEPSLRERVSSVIGPSLETLGMGLFVLILVLFFSIHREDLSDRVIQLFGRGRITLTTRTMDEVGQRISRYLAMLATVNTTFGLVVGVGLGLIGVPYAVLWGFLAAVFRFIPYAGPAAAFVLPVLFSIAHFPTWAEPLKVIGLFAVLEVAANTFLEPVIYGRTTGVSALGLLVAAMFWTWLWGSLGLLLSTPLTVCLAVLGKYVPSLGFFATLLGEESELEADLRFYQRLLALDQDGATEIVETALKQRPRIEVLDEILVPALGRAERDFVRLELEEREQAFIWRVVGDVLDDLEETKEEVISSVRAPTVVPSGAGEEREQAERPHTVVGVGVNSMSDLLVLRMLGLVLEPSGIRFEAVSEILAPLAVADRLADRIPDLLLVSRVPPGGFSETRYLIRRLHAVHSALPIFVGLWSQHVSSSALERLRASGAMAVATTLSEARTAILERLAPPANAPPAPMPITLTESPQQ